MVNSQHSPHSPASREVARLARRARALAIPQPLSSLRRRATHSYSGQVAAEIGSTSMPRKPKTIKPRRLYVPTVPAGASWFESDSYDRRTWNEIVADAPSIAELTESGERLVPHFGALVQDLF